MDTTDLDNLSKPGKCFKNKHERLTAIKKESSNETLYLVGYDAFEKNENNEFIRCSAILTFFIHKSK